MKTLSVTSLYTCGHCKRQLPPEAFYTVRKAQRPSNYCKPAATDSGENTPAGRSHPAPLLSGNHRHRGKGTTDATDYESHPLCAGERREKKAE